MHSVRPEAEILIGLKHRGHEVTVLTYADADYNDRFRAEGIKVLGGHPDKKYDRAVIAAIKCELQAGGHDCMILYNNRAITNGVLAARGLPVKVVGYRGAINIEWWNPLAYFKYLSPRIDKMICNSLEINKEFERAPFYDASKAVTIYKGHDPEWYADVVPHNLRAMLNIPENHTIFITVGNDRKVKGNPVILAAINQLPVDTPASFVFIGKGLEDAHYRKSVTEKWQDRVHLLGFKPDALSFVAGSDVFIQASIAGEALTKALIQAMCLRKMPLISNIDGNAPLVEDGKNGLKFQAGNSQDLSHKIQKVMAAPLQVKTMGDASRQRIEAHFHIRETIEAYERLLFDLCAD